MTPRELMDMDLWDKYCEISGISVVNEGLLDSADVFPINEEDMKKMGLEINKTVGGKKIV